MKAAFVTRRWAVRAVAIVPPLMGLSGCDQPAMENQPKMEAFESTAYFADGQVSRAPVPGTFARPESPAASQTPPAPTRQQLQRGRQRYDIFCTPCHGITGHGDGEAVQRGFPPPPSFHSERLRDIEPGHIYQVITKGYGVMYDYAARVPEDDRWAIAAYIKVLQLSQHATNAEVPEARSHLAAEDEQP